MFEVTALRNAGQRTSAYNLVYTTTVTFNGVDIPATLKAECSGAGSPTLARYQQWLINVLAVSQDLVTEYYPKGLKPHYPFVVEGISFVLDTPPVAPIEIILPLVWTKFRKELKSTTLHYHIAGYKSQTLDNVVCYSSALTALKFMYSHGHDLYDVLEEILLNFVLGKIEGDTWTYQSETYGPLSIVKSFDEVYGRELKLKTTANELYRIYTGMK